MPGSRKSTRSCELLALSLEQFAKDRRACCEKLFARVYICTMKILMVCLGNICRSPMAEGILQDKAFKAGLAWSVESAGTNGFHNGEPPHYLSQKIMIQHGIEIGHQKSRRFLPEDFDRFDKIYALAEDVLFDIKQIARKKFDRSKIDLLMNELYPGKDMDVPDPWSGPEEEYHEAFHLIDAACDALIRNYLSVNNPRRSPSDNIQLK